jgi:predicted lipoprotein with Yx(FWY)xxD motif
MVRRLAPVVLAAAVFAACGDDDETDSAAPPASAAATATATATPTPTPEPATAAAAPTARGKRIAIADSQFGDIVGDGRGQAVYIFDKERAGRSECYGDCARAWPPVLTRGRPVAGKGVRARLLGTVRRRGGKRQVTYRGQPLYYYVDDAPGRVLCHNVDEFGGLWLVVRANGRPVG